MVAGLTGLSYSRARIQLLVGLQLSSGYFRWFSLLRHYYLNHGVLQLAVNQADAPKLDNLMVLTPLSIRKAWT